MTIQQNTNELNVLMKNGSNANLDIIEDAIAVYVDRKIVNFKTANNCRCSVSLSTRL